MLLVAVRVRFRRRPKASEMLATIPISARGALAVILLYAFLSALYPGREDLRGVADVRDGKYVLLNRGVPPREISRADYDSARAENVRRFSSAWLGLLAIPSVFFAFFVRTR
jgi:hypothetical protein